MDGKWNFLTKKPFDNEVESQISSTDIENGYPKLKSAFVFWSERQTMF